MREPASTIANEWEHMKHELAVPFGFGLGVARRSRLGAGVNFFAAPLFCVRSDPTHSADERMTAASW